MKLRIQPTKSSKLLYIQKSVRNGKKVTSVIVKKLGRLDELMSSMNMSEEQVIVWAKDQVDELNSKKDSSDSTVVVLNNNAQIEIDDKRMFSAGYLFLQDILYSMKFKNIIRNIDNRHDYKYSLENIFSDLIYARILEPCSKRESYEVARSFLEPPRYDLHDVYRALSVIAEEDEYIQSEIYKNSNFIINRNNKILYYDCTNYFFEIEQEDELRKYGKSKEHRPNPIVQMGLFMDGDGIPLAYNLFPGNQNEQKSMTPTESNIINNFGFEKFIICTDAGLASTANKRFNHVDGRAYIITQSIKKLKGESKEWALSKDGFKRVGNDKPIKDIFNLAEEEKDYMEHLYYKEDPYDIKGIEQTLIITYSPKYAAYQKSVRDKQILRANKLVETGDIKRRRKNENDPARFISKKAVDTTTGEVSDTIHDSYYVDEDLINEEAKYDGFYALTTDLEDYDIKDILAISERRWEIEESFRIMKTDFSARPVYLQREDRIKAHFLICYMALLIYRVLEKKLEEKHTTEQLIKTLREYKLLKLSGDGYVPVYTRTQITDELHDVFNFRTDYQINPTSRMREIIKNTKR